MKIFGSQVSKEKNSSFYKRLWENWVTINTKINLELYFISYIRKKFKMNQILKCQILTMACGTAVK